MSHRTHPPHDFPSISWHDWLADLSGLPGGNREMSRTTSMRGGRAWLTAAAATAGLLALGAPAAAASTGLGGNAALAGNAGLARNTGLAGNTGLAARTARRASPGRSPAAAPKWRVVKSVSAGAGAFTAVVATGKATGWAFGG